MSTLPGDRRELRHWAGVQLPGEAPMTQPNLNEQQSAEHVNLSPYTMRNMRQAGRGPAFARLGGRVIYRRSDLDKWIAEHMVSTQDQQAA